MRWRDLFYPTLARNIINVYVPNKMWNMFLLWSAVLLVIYLIKMGMNYFVQYYGHVMGNRLQGDMRRPCPQIAEAAVFVF